MTIVGDYPYHTYLPAATPAAEDSERVRWVQSALNDILGLRLPVDGIMSRETRSALRSFQRRVGLPDDGILGPDTERALVAGRSRSAAGPEPPGPPQTPGPSEPPGPREEQQFLELAFPSFIPSLVAARGGDEPATVRQAIARGERDINKLTNMVFYARHPERQGRRLARGEPQFQQLSQEWLVIRDRLVRPALQGQSQAAAVGRPQGAFGSLTAAIPGRAPFRYSFTPDDVLWTARFITGEAGGRDDADNRAVIWAMFNRYALFTHQYYPTFHQFLRAYSTPLQPVLKSWGAARRHMHKPEFVRTGGSYPPPHQDIPRGQLRRFLKLQATSWDQLPAGARSLATQALQGQVPNPIGLASEFGSTYVYFHDQHGRYPNDEEWRRYTQAYARRKRWVWIGPVPGLNQKKNAFFVQGRVASLPPNVVRVSPPR